MAELLSPAGGWDSLVAAVQSGADAVYMGFGAYNAGAAPRTSRRRSLRRRCGTATSGG